MCSPEDTFPTQKAALHVPPLQELVTGESSKKRSVVLSMWCSCLLPSSAGESPQKQFLFCQCEYSRLSGSDSESVECSCSRYLHHAYLKSVRPTRLLGVFFQI